METRGTKGIKREQMKIEKNCLLTLTYNKVPLFLLIDNCKLKGETLEDVTEDKPEQTFGGEPGRTNPYKMWLLE